MNNENNLNIIRFFLAYIVFISHFVFLNNISFHNQLFENFATMAVNSFFLISGYLITRSCINKKNIYEFYKKRILRIFPAYYLMLFGILLFSIFEAKEDFVTTKTIFYFLYNSLFLNFLSPTNPHLFSDNFTSIVNGSLWTIKIELCLYFIAPFLIKNIEKRLILIIFFIALSTTWYVILSNDENKFFNILAIQFPGQLRFFLTGSFVYLYFDKIRLNRSYLILSFAAGVFSYLYLEILYEIIQPILLAIFVFYFGLRSRRIHFIKSDVSYGFYLFHFPIIQIFISRNNYDLSLANIFIIESVLIFILSFCSWNLIEKNFIKLGKR
jgi:peptidoglycan/LPS O-acetylase OafA/YrhL